MMNMNNLRKQAQQMQEEMQKVQEKLSSISVEASSGGGMVKVVCNCKMEVQSINIEPEVVDVNEKEMLEDLIVAAVNQAMQKAQARAKEEMGQVTGGLLGGMNLPGNFNIPGM